MIVVSTPSIISDATSAKARQYTGVAFQQFIGSLTGKKSLQIAESNAPNRLQTCSEMTELAESTPTVMAELMIRVESLFS